MLPPSAPPDVIPERWLSRLFDQARDYAIVLLDPEGRIKAWPDGARNVFGYDAQDVLGRPIRDVFTFEDQEVQAPANELAIAAAAGYAHDDRWHVRKDGSRFWASGATVPIRDDDGTLLGFGKIMRDRTDLRTQIETLKNRLAGEAQTQARKDLFLATLAHELRSPLQALTTAAQLIRVTVDATDVQYPLQVVERQIAFIRRMVDDLMDLTRMSTGKLQLELKSVVLQDALAEALASVAPAARARRQKLEAIALQPPLEIQLDPDRFQQILVNLLGNAIKFTPEGGTIWLKAGEETGHAVVRIADTGVGISPEMQPKLFELFTQGRVDEGRRTAGLGIGLALVKELVALHNGTVAVRSEGQGKGSEFTVRLPLRQPGPQGRLQGE